MIRRDEAKGGAAIGMQRSSVGRKSVWTTLDAEGEGGGRATIDSAAVDKVVACRYIGRKGGRREGGRRKRRRRIWRKGGWRIAGRRVGGRDECRWRLRHEALQVLGALLSRTKA